MRIALLQPTYWPEVRRGSERLVHDLAGALAGRGHEVSVLTSHRGRPYSATEDGVTVRRAWRPPERAPLSWYEHHVATMPADLWRVLRGRFDVAHAFFGPQAWAAVRARGLGGPPVVVSVHGILNRPYLVKRRYRLELLEEAVEAADGVNVLSEAAARAFGACFGREPAILSGGVVSAAFAADAGREAEPTLITAASLGDPRKRAGLLFEAFALLREQRPGVRLRVVRSADPVMSGAAPALPAGAEWIDADRTADLARAYSSAWASVLPAIDEAFGLVLIESLAAGTPVVAARSGACPEVVSDPAVGRLFEPDDPRALAAAMAEGLELGDSPGSSEACRAHAARWDWATVATRYERAYEAVIGR